MDKSPWKVHFTVPKKEVYVHKPPRKGTIAQNVALDPHKHDNCARVTHFLKNTVWKQPRTTAKHHKWCTQLRKHKKQTHTNKKQPKHCNDVVPGYRTMQLVMIKILSFKMCQKYLPDQWKCFPLLPVYTCFQDEHINNTRLGQMREYGDSGGICLRYHNQSKSTSHRPQPTLHKKRSQGHKHRCNQQ